MAHAGLPLPERLLHAVWGSHYDQEREYLRSSIHELRQKLEDDLASPRYVLTEAHVGYRFAEPSRGDGEH